MDLAKTTFHFSRAVPLALLVLLYTSAEASAGGKIFKTVDSNGAVTFTDVPKWLGPEVTRGNTGGAKIVKTEASTETQKMRCSTAEPGSKRHCERQSE